MKKILVILTTLILTSTFAQVTPSIKYPRFEVDSLGQKVVVMTIPQAMKLNNNSDLLKKFEAQDIKIKEYETLCVKVISEKDVVISKLTVTIGQQDGQLIVKDEKIKSLQCEIFGWLEKNKVLETQLANRQEVINEKNTQLGKLKTKMVIGGGLGTIAIIGLILMSIGIIQ
jgi:anion-transporting  ArsA/GET3 family ATPase